LVTRRPWREMVGVLFGLVLTNHTAWACSCVGPKGLNILSNNVAVFSGKVMAIAYLEPDANSSEPPIRVTFDVSEVWKGPVRRTVTLTTICNKYSCEGYFFKERQHYLVAASTLTRDDRVSDVAEPKWIFLSAGTGVLSDADEDLEEFGKGQRPE